MSSSAAHKHHDHDSTDPLNINSSKSRLASISNVNPDTVTADKLPSYTAALRSKDSTQQQHGLLSIRILLSKPQNEGPMKSMIESNTVPLLLSFFKSGHSLKMQFEAAWAVTNLCSGESPIVQAVCQSGAIAHFEELLNTTKHFEIMEQAVWGLGNIAGECQQYRNQIIKDGMFHQFLDHLESFLKSNTYSLCRNMVWALSNLLRYDGDGPSAERPDDPPPDLCPWDNLKRMVPVFERLLGVLGQRIKGMKEDITKGTLSEHDPDYKHCVQCLADSLWAIQNSQIYLSLAPRCSFADDVLRSKLVEMMVAFMDMDSVNLLYPSLRVIGTFLCEEDAITERVLAKGYLKVALRNLHCKVRNIRKEVCWTLSNVAGCERETAVKLIQFEEGALLKVLGKTCLFDDDSVKKEAGWVLANIVSLNEPEIIHLMVQRGVIGALRAVMKTSSVKQPLITCMEAFDVIMSHCRARDGGEYDYISKVEESGCCEIFDVLQAGVDDNDNVYRTSYELVQKYWPDDGGQPWQPYSGLSALRGHAAPQTNAQAIDITDTVSNEAVELGDDHEEDEDEDLVLPTQSGNQFGFGIPRNVQQSGTARGGDRENHSINGNQSKGAASGHAYQF